MHWLQTLDTNIFLFINRTLSNPFFDWLMPILSGNAWFIPVAILAGIAALIFGNARARVCTLMLLIVVCIGDPLIVNTIKNSVQRPRPFVTLQEARLFGSVGKGYVAPDSESSMESKGGKKRNYNSMPSAHSANWAAMTMVAFIFYRRSLWIMLPLALGVMFSRIYNGVHYPTDVLTGAILGAGYAIAILTGLEMSWRCAGKKFFPLWHRQLPSLLNPDAKIETEPASPSTPTVNADAHWLRLGYIIIAATLVARWIYIASGTIDLVKDEAYQWVWSKHLALSYYSKPPGIAWIQFAGTSLFGDTTFGVRFFSPLFAAILSVLTLRFVAREINARPAFWLLLIVSATPLLGLGTILMTIDPPLVLCWTWALIAGWKAVQPAGTTRDWIIVGLATGLGFLCKYTAACEIVCFTLFFALYPPSRQHLRKPGPWLGLLVFVLCMTPVIVWNAQHGWITVTHVAGDAGLHGHWKPSDAIRYSSDFLMTQSLLLNPVFFVGSIWAAIAFWKFRRERPLWLYFFCMGTPLYIGYALWSFHSRVLPNWIAPAILPMFLLMIAYWQNRAGIVRFFSAFGIIAGVFVVTIMYQTNLLGKIVGSPLPGEIDPVHRVRAWTDSAKVVESARKKLEAEGKPAFIIADHYGLTGEFSFYQPDARAAAIQTNHLVYCVSSEKPDNQFYFWPDYDYRALRKGQNAVYVSELDPYPLEHGWFGKWLTHHKVEYEKIPPPLPKPKRMLNEFDSVEDIGIFEITQNGHLVRRLQLWACYNLK